MAFSGTAQAAALLSGSWQSSCGPATCFDSHGVYSITFSAANFTGPVDISRFGFDRAMLGSMAGQFFNVSFQLGGQSIGSWGNWNMGAVAGDELWVSGQSLTWNPADGDLVLVFELVAPNGEKLGAMGAGGGGFSWGPPADPPQDHQSGGSVVVTLEGLNDAPVIDLGGDQGGPPNGGDNLPGNAQPAAAPEPSTWALAIGGMALAGAALRRRPRDAAAA